MYDNLTNGIMLHVYMKLKNSYYNDVYSINISIKIKVFIKIYIISDVANGLKGIITPLSKYIHFVPILYLLT